MKKTPTEDSTIGYTHYWRPEGPIDPTTFARLSKQAAEAVSLAWSEIENLELAYAYDEPDREPIFSDTEIRFNGVGDKAHETFCLSPRMRNFDFCKTAKKPYDVAVVAVLCLLAHHTGIQVTSDGDPSDWEAGLAFAKQVQPDCELPSGVADS